ncbi:polysaccharide biosynthesis C-terminal domain-containing protein [Vibrio coralliilyticus]|uniref:Polysaccharide biosynthesis protein C-terminal domain-containing protein n=1 Tax=Vibrio coralliilyticus TaxID=190893 RepID=A0AAP6ZNZ6_9VIBR|nr:polysaccharide biosynthesis C-terminal domain-containing protein [Vibrio coralliilyticus]NOJ23991.1 hypothetical protein [Vibrio coralliilyticus]
MMKRNVITKVMETSGAKFYGLFVGVFSLSYSAHVLGVEGRGLFATVTTWIGMFAVLSSLSLGQSFFKALSLVQGKPKKELVGSSFYLVIALSSFASLSWFASFLIGVLPEMSLSLLIVGGVLIPLFIWDQISPNIMSSLGLISSYNKSVIISRTVTIGSLFILLAVEPRVEFALIATFLGYTIAFLFNYNAIYSVLGVVKLRVTYIKTLVIEGGKLHLNTITAFVVSGTDIIMLSKLSTMESVGHYQLSVQLLNLLYILPQSIALIVYGMVDKNGKINWFKHRNLLFWGIASLVVLVPSIFLLSDFFIRLIAGEAFLESAHLLKMQSMILLPAFLAIMLAPQWISQGYVWTMSIVGSVSAILNLCLNYFLIPIYDTYGAIYSSAITYYLFFPINIWMIWKCQRLR